MKSALRILKKVALWTLAVAVVLVVAVLAINSRDERLSPQAVRLLKAPPDLYRPRDNLFFLLWGLDAPAGTSAVAAGQAKVRTYEARFRKGFGAFGDAVDKPVPGTLVFKGKMPGGWRSMDTIWREATDHKAWIHRMLAANRVLYRRYRALHHATGYYDTETPSGFALPPYPPMGLRQLFLADFALRMQSGSVAQQAAALADLEDDLKVWETVFRGYGSQVAEDLAVDYLRQDLLLIGDMIADPELVLSTHRAAVKHLVALFPISEWRKGSTLSYDYREGADGRAMLDSGPSQKALKESLWTRVEYALLFKRHATDNFWANITVRLSSIVNGPPRAFEKSWSGYAKEVDCVVTPRISCLYNPLPKRYVTSTLEFEEQDVLKAYDVAALQRMVKLAYEIRVRRVAPGDVPTFMQRHPQWSTHPVDGKSFVFNPVKRQLALVRVAKGVLFPVKHRHFVIPVWISSGRIGGSVQ